MLDHRSSNPRNRRVLWTNNIVRFNDKCGYLTNTVEMSCDMRSQNWDDDTAPSKGPKQGNLSVTYRQSKIGTKQIVTNVLIYPYDFLYKYSSV